MNADLFLIKAIQGDAELMATIDNRLFDPARTDEAELEDKVPYVVVSPQSGEMVNDDKDMEWDSLEDTETIDVMVVANTRAQLATMCNKLRLAVNELLEDGEETLDFDVTDIDLSWGAVEYDNMKPCFFRTMTYKLMTMPK